jgi:cytochrome c peroxidase
MNEFRRLTMRSTALRPYTVLLTTILGGAAVTAFFACSSEDTPGTDTTVDASAPDSPANPNPDGSTDAGPYALTIQEMQLAKEQSPLPAIPPSPTNKYADNADAAKLGQMFFFDKSIAGPIVVAGSFGNVGEVGKVSCADCHIAPWGTDTRGVANGSYGPNAVSLGVNWTTRNTPPIVNVAFYQWFYWDGRSDSLWQQAALAGENALQQGSDRLRIAHVVYTKYKGEYEKLFAAEFGPLDARFDPANGAAFPASGKPGVAEYDGLPTADQSIITRVLVNWAKAIEAYERLLVSRNAPWDRFVAGDANAISQAAIHGYKLFTSKGYCVNCHSGPLFSDNKPRNIGVPNNGTISDKGRYDTIVKALANKFRGDGAWSDDKDAGAAKLATQFDYDAGLLADGGPNFDMTRELGLFRTKHLRQIEHTGPYMHNGEFATLEGVMGLYTAGGGDSGVGTLDPAFEGHVPMTLDEQADVIEFMKTLTGDPVPSGLMSDTSKP